MTERDVIPFVRQLLVFVDLWIRIDTMEKILVNKDGTDSEVVKSFIKNYLDVYTAYTAKILGLCYKKPTDVSEANSLDLLKMLRNINPALRDQIGKVIVDIFFRADMKGELDVYSLLKPTIDGILSSNNLVNGSHEIDINAVNAFVTIPND